MQKKMRKIGEKNGMRNDQFMLLFMLWSCFYRKTAEMEMSSPPEIASPSSFVDSINNPLPCIRGSAEMSDVYS